MAKKHDLLGVAGADTVIGTGVKLRGNLVTEGDILIDGTLTGNVKSRGNLDIGVNAHVTGDVSAESITVAGQLDGNIRATGDTTIAETGQVTGDIATGRLHIDMGAIFIGTSKMKVIQASEVATRELNEGA
jgi:cytoskeletal protein CcmA (bactofilin family)